MIEKPEQLFQTLTGAFSTDFDGTIRAVAHPAGQAEPRGFFDGVGAEVHALHTAMHNGLQLLMFWSRHSMPSPTGAGAVAVRSRPALRT